MEKNENRIEQVPTSDEKDESQKEPQKDLIIPLPFLSMKLSLDYLMDFFLNTTSCICTDPEDQSFTDWLYNLYILWHLNGYVKKNLLETEDCPIPKVDLKEYDLEDMVNFFNGLPDKKTLLRFMSEVGAYYVLRLYGHVQGKACKQRYWYNDGYKQAIPRYENLKEMVARCPYV